MAEQDLHASEASGWAYRWRECILAMRRLCWTAGVALVGFWFGWFGQGYPFNFAVLAIFTTWGGCIGYGFGSIFDQRHPTRRIIVYWAFTLALVGSLLFPLMPLRFVPAQVGVTAGIGALMGFLVGSLHLKLARRKSPASDTGSVTG